MFLHHLKENVYLFLFETVEIQFSELKYSEAEAQRPLVKGVLKIYSKFTGEHPCRNVISLKLQAALLKSHFGVSVLL